jgi:hypothetical protein
VTVHVTNALSREELSFLSPGAALFLTPSLLPMDTAGLLLLYFLPTPSQIVLLLKPSQTSHVIPGL